MPLNQITDGNNSCGSCDNFIGRECMIHKIKTHESESCDKFKSERLALDVIKCVDDEHLAFGWLYVSSTKDGKQVVDHSGDIVKISTIEKAAYEYVLSERVAGAMHEKEAGEIKKVGSLVESVVFTAEKKSAMGIPKGMLPDGMWVGYKVDDEKVWQKIKSGEYKMLSLGSRVLTREIGE